MANEIVNLNEEIRKQLELQATAIGAIRTTGAFITFKNANLKVDGTQVPNNTLEVRVLACVGERAWYADAFDPDTPQVPACYALDGSIGPHPESQEPQSDTCASCPKNKWGSAPPRPGSSKPGRGKACREGARLVLAPAMSNITTAPLYQAKVPVTSLSEVVTFLTRCSQSGKLTGEFVTQLSVTEDKKTFFRVHLDIRELSPDLDMTALVKKQNEAHELATQPYPDIEQ